ncbi:hypothetical protein GGR42_000454 [Saonia flava]|uniref:DUF6249 domain-containing protein n=1 Tax=Saonia flava TaxID=523696 RepID=A0A846QU00_9FLAO|nr:DUF6249 domain-containing protein [Saonia flava]NJB69992.1 hypothetical protein [Saonia flava]
MHSELIIVPIFFGVVFAIAYLYFSTRNKERLALIEKGADASIFVRGKKENAAPIWKVLILNASLILMGIGMGVFIAAILVNAGIDDDVAYPGTIFLMAGIGLFVGFTMTKKLDKE